MGAAATVLLDPVVVAAIPAGLQLGDNPHTPPRFVVTIAAGPVVHAGTAAAAAAAAACLPRCFEATVSRCRVDVPARSTWAGFSSD